MAIVRFTDLAIRSLSDGVYFDERTRGFGLLVGKTRKTWLVVKGRNRAKHKIGHYPALSLADARKKAVTELATPIIARTAPLFPVARDEYPDQGNWRARTRYETSRTLKKYFNWAKTLDKITHLDVMAAISAIDAPSEAAHAFKDIRAFFNWCVPHLIPTSPCAGLKSPSRYVPRDRLLSDAEIISIWRASETLGDYGLQIRRLIVSGQRVNQIFSLQSEWIDPAQALITFPASIMKNNIEHRIPYGTFMEGLLSEFPTLTSQGKMKRRLDDLSQVSQFTLHDFRRYFSSTHARLRTPIDITEALLAHVSGSRSPIQRIYDRHDRLDEMREAMTRWEEHLTKLLTATVKIS